MTSVPPKVIPRGKTRIVLRTTDGTVLSDMLVDNGSLSVITLPSNLDLRLSSVEMKP
jgi:hypothetical protein